MLGLMTMKTWDQGTISFNVQDLENHESCVEKTAKLLFGLCHSYQRELLQSLVGQLSSILV